LRAKNEKLKVEMQAMKPSKPARANIGSFIFDSVLVRSADIKRILACEIPGDGPISTQLLYRASRDGWLQAQFHAKCDDQKATLVIFKTSAGRLCGGFTSVDWQ